MKCIIIDDEKHCIKTLTNLLEKNFSEVDILASCTDATKAYDLIEQHKPDFIFLDIEMPLLNGFDLLSRFENLFFEVIFMTYSYVNRMINTEAFPNAIDLYDKNIMTGRGRGKYCYNSITRVKGEELLRLEIAKHFPNNKIMYIV